jgi:hypothetical protein
MASGVSWNPNHTDITNYYLHMGVVGGLPMMLLFIAAVAKGFFIVGKRLHSAEQLSEMQQYLLWALGCTLFAHAATFISVSYFDQSSVFVYLTFAALGSAARTGAVPVMAARHEEVAAGPKGRRNTGARPALLPKPAAVAASRYVVNARGARRVKVAHSIKRGD